MTCSFGTPIVKGSCGPCAKCVAQLDKDCEAFDRDVFFGVYDREGYTPAERKAQAKRKAAEQ